jgi:hypothetical protein
MTEGLPAPHWWGDVKLEQIGKLLSAPPAQLPYLGEVLGNWAQRLHRIAEEHGAAWRHAYEENAGEAMAKAYDKADELRKKIVDIARTLEHLDSALDSAVAQYGETRRNVEHAVFIARNMDQARGSLMGWLDLTDPQREEQVRVDLVETARRAVTDLEKSSRELLAGLPPADAGTGSVERVDTQPLNQRELDSAIAESLVRADEHTEPIVVVDPVVPAVLGEDPRWDDEDSEGSAFL